MNDENKTLLKVMRKGAEIVLSQDGLTVRIDDRTMAKILKATFREEEFHSQLSVRVSQKASTWPSGVWVKDPATQWKVLQWCLRMFPPGGAK